ncbi:MAG: DUF255 domain-containing protein [Salinigranum sp.]
MDDESRVAWRDWGTDAFAEARERECPLLLSLTATWCGSCHEMDAQTYGDPVIAARVEDDFVPVRIDVDRRPRVRERYTVGGFPSTVFATPAGRVISGTNYLGPRGMRQVLDRVREAWEDRGADAGRLPRALAGDLPPAGEVDARIERQIAGQLREAYDDAFAGWGEAPKFPLPRTVEFALSRELEQARATLDAIERSLLDDAAGGFFRYAEGRDWSDPHREKLLDENAALVGAFARGYLHTGDDAYRRAADRGVDFLVDTLWTGAGFGGSQAAREDGATAADAPAPRRDRTVYAGANALAAEALLTYYAVTDDDRARTHAVRTLDEIASRLVDHGAVAHYRERGETGETFLLEDHARVTAAFARAAQVLGGGHLDVARDVADGAVGALFEDGSFLDGPAEGAGLLDRPLRPLDANAEMADALFDLALLTGESRYRDVAEETVGAFAGAWDRLGVQVAAYGAVAGRLCRPTLRIDVGGPAGSDLHRAALRVADHGKVVRPEAGVDDGTATVRLGEASEAARTPDELMAGVAAVRERRE